MLATNHKPIIRGDDHAIWRRIHLIPFDVSFSGSQRNPHLLEQLLSELPGIFCWAVKGALEYQSMGLAPPKRIIDVTAEYRSDMDMFGDWIEERCTKDSSATTPVGDLYDSYSGWCRANGSYPLGKIRFSNRLADRGYGRNRSGKVRSFIGLAIKPTPEEEKIEFDIPINGSIGMG